jgi:hypothetical protein
LIILSELKISFSKYDYFGIILPGFIILIFFIFIVPIEFYINIGILIDSFGNIGFVFVFFISIGTIIISYIIGSIISGIAYWLIEGLIITKKLKYPSYNLFKNNNGRTSHKFFHDYRKQYTDEFKNNFNQVFHNYFKESKYEDIDKFKLCFHVVKENSSVTFGRLTTFISLYSLYRNLTITFFIGSILYLYNFIITLNFIFLFFIGFLLLSIFCFTNFLKFFRIYADEVFRSFYIYILEKYAKKEEEGS